MIKESKQRETESAVPAAGSGGSVGGSQLTEERKKKSRGVLCDEERIGACNNTNNIRKCSTQTAAKNDYY